MLFLASCQGTGDRYKNLADTHASRDIQSAVDIQNQKSGEVHQSVDVIRKNAEDIQKESAQSKNTVEEIKVPENEAKVVEIAQSLEKISKASSTITTESKKIDDAVIGIEGQSKNILQSNTKILELEKQIRDLKNANSEAEQKAKQSLYKILGIAFGLGFATVITGVVLLFVTVNKNLGYAICGIGVLTLAMAAGALFFLETIAYIGIAIIALGVITALLALVWKIFKADREIVTLNQANVENVRLVEAVKQVLPVEKKLELFGDRAIPGKVQNIQTEKTKKLVAKIRKEILKPEIEETIPASKEKGN
jgi:hypothetical protein